MAVENVDKNIKASVHIGHSNAFISHGIEAATQLVEAGDMEGATKILEHSAQKAMEQTQKAEKLLNPKP